MKVYECNKKKLTTKRIRDKASRGMAKMVMKRKCVQSVEKANKSDSKDGDRKRSDPGMMTMKKIKKNNGSLLL